MPLKIFIYTLCCELVALFTTLAHRLGNLFTTLSIWHVEERNGLYALLPDEVNRCNAKKGRGVAKYARVRTFKY